MHKVNHGENIIEVRNVSFAYGDEKVLKDINLDIHRGDYLGIVGGNGSGKTTLLKIILGLLSPQTGKVLIFGKDARTCKDREKIGYVPQKTASFDPNFPVTAEEAVLMGRYADRGLFRGITEEDKKKTREALRAVDMESHKDRMIGELSGGEAQRIFIARALVTDPEVIFLDEPTTAVDREGKEEFYALLERLNKEMNLTVILITHDIEHVSGSAMHIACVDGTLFFHASVEGYLNSKYITHHCNHA